jgi:hypothetical protein
MGFVYRDLSNTNLQYWFPTDNESNSLMATQLKQKDCHLPATSFIQHDQHEQQHPFKR